MEYYDAQELLSDAKKLMKEIDVTYFDAIQILYLDALVSKIDAVNDSITEELKIITEVIKNI